MKLSKIALNISHYNTLVKRAYFIDETGMQYLIDEELNKDAIIPYHEIPRYMAISGHAEIFEPEL